MSAHQKIQNTKGHGECKEHNQANKTKDHGGGFIKYKKNPCILKNMESSNGRNTWFNQPRRWLTNEHPTFQTWEPPPPPIEYWDVDPDFDNVEVEAEPVQEANLSNEQHVPVYSIHPVRLNRTNVGMNDDDDDPNPILPGFWWILGYMALTALTAVGIRQSIK